MQKLQNSAENYVIYSDPRPAISLKSGGSQMSEAEAKMHTVPSKSGAKQNPGDFDDDIHLPQLNAKEISNSRLAPMRSAHQPTSNAMPGREVFKYMVKQAHQQNERSRDPYSRATRQQTMAQPPKKDVILTELELKTYGNRVPRGY